MCLNIHFVVNAHGLSFGLKNEMLKMDQLPHTYDFEKYSTNWNGNSFYTSHMAFGMCWNHHFMHRPHGLGFGLKSENAKLDILQIQGEIEEYSTNWNETSFYTSHMSFGDCMSCQNSWHELA